MIEIVAVTILCVMLIAMTLGMIEATRIAFARACRTSKARRIEGRLRSWWVFLPLSMIVTSIISAAMTWMYWPGFLVIWILSTLVAVAVTGSLRVGVFTFIAFAPMMITQSYAEVSPSFWDSYYSSVLWLGSTVCSIGFLVVVYGVGLWMWARRMFKAPGVACPECGYDVCGLPQDICPECGTVGVVAGVD